MHEPKRIDSKPRPWSLPRLQGTIGNRAVHRMLKPPAPPPAVDLAPEAEPGTAPPETQRWPWGGILLGLGLVLGALLGGAIERTRAAPYAGTALGAALGLVLSLLLVVNRRRTDP
jgi:hypothetical protein